MRKANLPAGVGKNSAFRRKIRTSPFFPTPSARTRAKPFSIPFPEDSLLPYPIRPLTNPHGVIAKVSHLSCHRSAKLLRKSISAIPYIPQRIWTSLQPRTRTARPEMGPNGTCLPSTFLKRKSTMLIPGRHFPGRLFHAFCIK